MDKRGRLRLVQRVVIPDCRGRPLLGMLGSVVPQPDTRGLRSLFSLAFSFRFRRLRGRLPELAVPLRTRLHHQERAQHGALAVRRADGHARPAGRRLSAQTMDGRVLSFTPLMCLPCLQTASQLDSVGQVDIKYEDYPFTPTSMASPHSWCALSQA